MIRVDDAGDITKCWLSLDELSTLERSAGKGGWEREIAVQLMALGYSSLSQICWFQVCKGCDDVDHGLIVISPKYYILSYSLFVCGKR